MKVLSVLALYAVLFFTVVTFASSVDVIDEEATDQRDEDALIQADSSQLLSSSNDDVETENTEVQSFRAGYYPMKLRNKLPKVVPDPYPSRIPYEDKDKAFEQENDESSIQAHLSQLIGSLMDKNEEARTEDTEIQRSDPFAYRRRYIAGIREAVENLDKYPLAIPFGLLRQIYQMLLPYRYRG